MSYDRGLLGSLVSSRRDAPLSPDAFATVLSKKEFTNGADSATVINLYRNTATALLGSTRELSYKELAWKDAQFERLGEALCYCGALETLEVKEMELSDTAAAAVVAGLASCTSLKTLNLDIPATPSRRCPICRRSRRCRRSGSNADPSRRCPTCRRSRRCRRSTSVCSSLTALPDLSALTSLQDAHLYSANPSRLLPDLLGAHVLKVKNLPASAPDAHRGRRSTSSTASRRRMIPNCGKTSDGWPHECGSRASNANGRSTCQDLKYGATFPAVAVGGARAADRSGLSERAAPSRRCPTCRRSRRCRRSTSVTAAPSRRCPTSRRSRRCRRSTSMAAGNPSRRCPTSRRRSHVCCRRSRPVSLTAASMSTPSRRCPTCRRSRRCRRSTRWCGSLNNGAARPVGAHR